MNNTELYIENQLVELDKSVQFAITRQFEDLSNPTVIINDWSKTISIPFTANNNNLFGNLYRNDRTTAVGDSEIGIYFDPQKKHSFRLVHNGDVIMVGYAKLNSIKSNAGRGSYEVSLFGKLGELFGELQNITASASDKDSKYYIGDIIRSMLNRNLVNESWSRTPSLDTPMFINGERNENCRTTDIIGFACANQGYNDDFDSSSYQTSNTESISFADTIQESYDEAKISVDSVIGDGLLPRAWGEYRSYYQVPFIYMPRMFEILAYKCKDLTDYDLVLDKDWFNTKNPYYQKMVMMLSRSTRSSANYNNSYYFYPLETDYYWTMYDITRNTINNYLIEQETIQEEIPVYSGIGGNFDIPDSSRLYFTAPYKFRMSWRNVENGTARFLNNPFVLEVRASGANGVTKVLHKTIVKSYSYNYTNTDDNTTVIDVYNMKKQINESGATIDYYTDFEDSFTIVADRDTFGEYVEIMIYGYFMNTNSPFSINIYGTSGGVMFGSTGRNDRVYIQSTSPHTQVANVQVEATTRSNSLLTFETIWNSEYSFFGEILKYTKMFGLIWEVDNNNKTLSIKSKQKYFSNYKIEDWTSKIDASKDYTIQPIILDSKYYKFNYKDSDESFNKLYKEDFGINYGEIRLKTNYEFDNKTHDYFKDIPNSIVNTEAILDWNHIVAKDIVYINPGEVMPHFANEDNKTINTFGQYYFYNGIRNFSDKITPSYPIITDDTPKQITEGKYMYINRLEGYYVVASTYPSLNIITKESNKEFMCLFNVPQRSYDYTTRYENTLSIYNEVWKSIIENELLNMNTHQLTCYLKLSQLDYSNFTFNKFVKVNNQLYLVNKIYDYDFNSNVTKCDLIKINNPENYTISELMKNIDIIDVPGTFYISGDSTTKHMVGSIESITDVTFEDGTTSKRFDNAYMTVELINNDIYVTTDIYAGKEDITLDVAVKNSNSSAVISFDRYSTYPYPRVNATSTKGGSNINSIGATEGTIWVQWYNIENDKLPTHPTLTITSENNVMSFTQGTWEATAEHMEQDSEGYEWFYYNEWQLPVSYVRKSGGTDAVTLTITDSIGYSNTKTLNVPIGMVKPGDYIIM